MVDRLSASIDRYLEVTYCRDRPGAAIRVSVGDKVLMERGFGLATLPNKTIETGSVFRIGSVSKQLTAVAVLRLVEHGQIELTTEVASALGFDSSALREIQVHHLLAHTSGLPPTGGESWEGPSPTPNDLLEIILGIPPVARPGERWLYTDWGYVLLGLLVERISGLGLGDYFRKYFFEPLGMGNTSYSPAVPQTGCVEDYQLFDRELRPTDWSKLRPPYGEAAVLSTVGDLARWSQGLDDGRLLRPETLTLARTPYRLAGGQAIPYGFGFALNEVAGEQIAEHGGNIGGFRAHLLTSQPTGLFIAILANAADARPSPSYIADRIARALLGQPWQDREVAFPPGILERYVGNYLSADGSATVITLENARLYCSHSGRPRCPLLWRDVGTFALRHTLTLVEFEGMAHGPAARLRVIPRYGESVVAERQA